jgi:hypothetical protein
MSCEPLRALINELRAEKSEDLVTRKSAYGSCANKIEKALDSWEEKIKTIAKLVLTKARDD